MNNIDLIEKFSKKKKKMVRNGNRVLGKVLGKYSVKMSSHDVPISIKRTCYNPHNDAQLKENPLKDGSFVSPTGTI